MFLLYSEKFLRGPIFMVFMVAWETRKNEPYVGRGVAYTNMARLGVCCWGINVFYARSRIC